MPWRQTVHPGRHRHDSITPVRSSTDEWRSGARFNTVLGWPSFCHEIVRSLGNTTLLMLYTLNFHQLSAVCSIEWITEWEELNVTLCTVCGHHHRHHHHHRRRRRHYHHHHHHLHASYCAKRVLSLSVCVSVCVSVSVYTLSRRCMEHCGGTVGKETAETRRRSNMRDAVCQSVYLIHAKTEIRLIRNWCHLGTCVVMIPRSD